MADPAIVKEWLGKADDDFRFANLILKKERGELIIPSIQEINIKLLENLNSTPLLPLLLLHVSPYLFKRRG